MLLSIAFTGFVRWWVTERGVGEEVLLVDAVGVGVVRGCRLPEHAPTLVISLGGAANPDSGPAQPRDRGDARRGGPGRPTRSLGLEGIRGAHTAAGGSAALRLFQPTANETSWPEPPQNTQDPAAWRDLRYLASMQALVGDGRIDPAVLNDDGSGRGHLPWR